MRIRSLGAFVVLVGLTAMRPAPAAAQASFLVSSELDAGQADEEGVSLARVAEAEVRWGLRIGIALDGLVAPDSDVDRAAAIAAGAVGTADGLVGARYRWGGDSPAVGFDCSGFVQYVFRQHGIDLPRVSRDQAHAGRPLPTSLEGLAPGDLLFFAQRGPSVDHVAIYAGDGRIVHASRSGYGVRSDDLSGDRGRWYAQHLVAVRRVIEDAADDAPEPLRAASVGQ